MPRMVLLVLGMIAFMLVACGGRTTPSPVPSPTPSPTAVPSPTPAPTATVPAAPGRTAALPFSLPDATGKEVSLEDVVQAHEAVVLVFYRGFF